MRAAASEMIRNKLTTGVKAVNIPAMGAMLSLLFPNSFYSSLRLTHVFNMCFITRLFKPDE